MAPDGGFGSGAAAVVTGGAVLPFLGILVVPLPIYLLWFRYRLVEFRYFVSVSEVGGARFHSDARFRTVLVHGLITFAVFAGALVVLLIVFGGVMASVPAQLQDMQDGASNPQRTAQVMTTLVPLFAGMALLAIVFAFSSPLVMFLLLYFPVARHLAETLTIHNLAAVDSIVQSTRDDPRFGEGLADALDVELGPF